MAVDPRIQAALEAPHGARPHIAKVKRREGYAAAPGTGPYGETCHSCRHCGPARGNEYAAVCGIGKKSPMGGPLYISVTAAACVKFEARR